MDGVTDLNRNGHGGFCRHCTAQHPLNPFLSLLYMGTMVGVSQDLVQGEPPLVSSVCLFFRCCTLSCLANLNITIFPEWTSKAICINLSQVSYIFVS